MYFRLIDAASEWKNRDELWFLYPLYVIVLFLSLYIENIHRSIYIFIFSVKLNSCFHHISYKCEQATCSMCHAAVSGCSCTTLLFLFRIKTVEICFLLSVLLLVEAEIQEQSVLAPFLILQWPPTMHRKNENLFTIICENEINVLLKAFQT